MYESFTFKIFTICFSFNHYFFVINRIIDWFLGNQAFDEEVEQTIQSVIRSFFRYIIIISLIIYLISQFVDIKSIIAGAG